MTRPELLAQLLGVHGLGATGHADDTAAPAPATLVPADLDNQDLLSGATTLYVTAECDTLGGTSVVTTDYPKLHITTLPS